MCFFVTKWLQDLEGQKLLFTDMCVIAQSTFYIVKALMF